MFDLDTWQEIWLTITQNKWRSIFTAFGVFWGILMLTILLGAGRGLENGMMSQIEGFATNSCFIYAGRTSVNYEGFKKGRQWNMCNADMVALRENIPEISHLSPMLFGGKSANNTVRGERAGSFSVRGCYPDYTHIETQHLLYGRFINEMDIRENRKACFIGQKVYERCSRPVKIPLVRLSGSTVFITGSLGLVRV
jgi:putative ABC transport system permease protein